MTGLTAAVEQDDGLTERVAADVADQIYISECRKFPGHQRTRGTFSIRRGHK
jgi:hypothetical protein